MAVVFALDLATRLGVAVWLLYLAPLAATLPASSPLAPRQVAAGATLLTVAG